MSEWKVVYEERTGLVPRRDSGGRLTYDRKTHRVYTVQDGSEPLDSGYYIDRLDFGDLCDLHETLGDFLDKETEWVGQQMREDALIQGEPEDPQ